MSFQTPHFTRLEYNQNLYKSETKLHSAALEEYGSEIFRAFSDALDLSKPNLDLYKQQPYLTFPIRLKLIDFLLKMSVRLKIIPFVFFRAVKLFDRYCSKRVILLDQSQLIITTCLWIAAKLQGGNNHFVNLSNVDKMDEVKTINDLGYGSGGKYLGPTERFRLPKLHELVKLCGAKCKYDQNMFKQMELHVLATLDWSFNDPSIEEFIVKSSDFNILVNNEFFKVKEYLCYISLYASELIDTHIIDLGKVILDMINETFNLNHEDYHFQSINIISGSQRNFSGEYFIDTDELPNLLDYKLDYHQYKFIKKNLIKAILRSSDYILKVFDSKGPQFLYRRIFNHYKDISSSSFEEATRLPPPHKLYDHPTVTASNTSAASPMDAPQTISSPATISVHASPVSIYRPMPTTSVAAKINTIYDLHAGLPRITTKHQHHPNDSQASLSSAVSRENDIFESDARPNGVHTPVSDEESPEFADIKQLDAISKPISISSHQYLSH